MSVAELPDGQMNTAWGDAWGSLSWTERLALAAGSAAAGVFTAYLSSAVHIPTDPGRAGLLLQQHGWPIALLVSWLCILAGGLIGAVLTLRMGFDAGLFCACIGLDALAIRSGPTHFALFAAKSGGGVYVLMAVELALLFVGLSMGWMVLRWLSSLGIFRGEMSSTIEFPNEPLDQKLLALLAQVIVMIFGMLLLCATDSKAQTLGAIAVSSYVATLAAYHFISVRPSGWYWAGPMVVGIVGYMAQSFSPTDWMIGDARGFFAALARPLPLDYAAAGPAAAMLAYWTSVRWHNSGPVDSPVE